MRDTLSNAELSRLSMSVTRPIPISSLDTNQDQVVDWQEVAAFMASRGELVDQVSWLQLQLVKFCPSEDCREEHKVSRREQRRRLAGGGVS